MLGFVTDSANVVVATRRYLTRKKEGGSNLMVLLIGCMFHVFSNFVKDFCQHDAVKDTLARTIKLTPLFRNTHVTSELLDNTKKTITESPQSIKVYYTTQLNGVDVLFELVHDNKNPIIDVILAHMAIPADRVRPISKVTAVKEFATEFYIGPTYKNVSSVFKLMNKVLMFMEGDSVTISVVPLCFTIIYKVVNKLSFPADFVVHVRTSIRNRLKTIRSEVYAILLVLHPSVSRSRWSDVKFLYNKEDEITNQSHLAFKNVCK